MFACREKGKDSVSMSQWEVQYQSLQQYRHEVEALPRLSEEEALVLVQAVIRARSEDLFLR